MNWNLLQGIQPGQGAIASAPAAPGGGGGGADSLAGGISAGLSQGTSMAASRQNMAAQQQQMEFNKQMNPMKIQEAQQTLDYNSQMNPLKVQQGQQTVEGGAIDLQEKKQKQIDAQTLRAAAAQGEQQWLDAKMQQDPEAAQKYNLAKADVAARIAATAGINEDTKGKGLDNASKISNIQGQIYNAALGSTDPAMREKIYQAGKATLPKDLQTSMPAQFDEGTAVATLTLAKQNMADWLEKNQGKNMSSAQKDDQRQIALQNKVNSGTANANDKAELDMIQGRRAAIEKRGQPTNPLDSELAKTDSKQASDAQTSRESMKTFHDDVNSAREILTKVPDAALGPAVNITKLNKLNPEIQKLQSTLNGLALQAKELYKLGSGQGFTDADRDFLTEVVGNTAINKRPLGEILDRMDDLAGKAHYNSWKKESNVRKKASGYDQWLQDNPEPSKSWDKISKPDQTSGGFQAGQIYQDANGNKAKYNNGTWEPV